MTALPGLADWLHRALEARGWNQARLVRESKLSKGFVSELLSGKAKGREHDTQVALAQAFGMSHAAFVAAVRSNTLPAPGGHDRSESTERAILSDPDLTSRQREALIVHYRSYRPG